MPRTRWVVGRVGKIAGLEVSMPRALWSGSISFGLVSIPVKLYSAVSRKAVRFNQIDSRTGSRVRQKRVSADDGSEVSYDDIVKGYDLGSGTYVVVTEEELAALDPVSDRTIEIDEFVDLDEIDPIYYDAAYYLVPDGSAKPFALLTTALQESNKVGIASFVMRTRQHLAAIRPKDGALLLSTMVRADEVVDPASLDGYEEVEAVEVRQKELRMATELIASLTDEFQPERHPDTYREEVLALVERKAAGEDVVVPEEDDREPAQVIDLMDALQASVEEAREARTRHPTGTKASKEAAKKRASAKKSSGSKASTKNASTKKATAKKVANKGGGAKKKTPAKKAASKKKRTTASPARKSA